MIKNSKQSQKVYGYDQKSTIRVVMIKNFNNTLLCT